MLGLAWLTRDRTPAIVALFLLRAGLRKSFLPAERQLLVLACLLTEASVLAGPSSARGASAWLLTLARAWRRDRAARVSPAPSGLPCAGT